MPNTPTLHVLGIAGSLQERSYNKALIRAADELAPERMNIELFDLAGVPLYNADRDTEETRPATVRRLKQAIDDADGLLVATPEYNHGVSGVLKNAIDWASRPGHNSVLKAKPVGIVGASGGPVGTARAQEHLKQIFEATLSYLMPHPGVLVARSSDKFEDGRLTHEATRSLLADYLKKLAKWGQRFKKQAEVD